MVVDEAEAAVESYAKVLEADRQRKLILWAIVEHLDVLASKSISTVADGALPDYRFGLGDFQVSL